MGRSGSAPLPDSSLLSLPLGSTRPTTPLLSRCTGVGMAGGGPERRAEVLPAAAGRVADFRALAGNFGGGSLADAGVAAAAKMFL